MKKIGIITNLNKDIMLEYTNQLIHMIQQYQMKYIIPPYYDLISGESSTNGLDLDYREEMVIAESDFVICLGGDGTFLKAARKASRAGVPILGVNLGQVGFLTEINRNHIEEAIQEISEGNYQVEDRMMLNAVVYRQGKKIVDDIAINDIVISKLALARILRLNAYINSGFIDVFPGDGIILSTPTGSTAYSLSAGGPIVQPDVRLIILTPICPHTLYSRSVITDADKTVRIIVDRSSDNKAMLTFDGQEGCELMAGDVIEVTKSPYELKLASIEKRNFFDVLREKIYGGGGNKCNEV